MKNSILLTYIYRHYCYNRKKIRKKVQNVSCKVKKSHICFFPCFLNKLLLTIRKKSRRSIVESEIDYFKLVIQIQQTPPSLAVMYSKLWKL